MNIKSKFCPSCGKKINKLYEGLCLNCYSTEYTISISKRRNVRYCTVCKSVYWNGLWLKTSLPPEHYLEKRVAANLKLRDGESLKSIRIKKLGRNGEIEVKTKLFATNQTQTLSADVEVTKYCCPNCSREQGVTHTAKIQLRTNKERHGFVMEVIDFLGKARKKVLKAEDRKKGVDLYFTDKSYARRLARRLKTHFKGKLKETASQYGWNKQKNRPLYRSTLLITA